MAHNRWRVYEKPLRGLGALHLRCDRASERDGLTAQAGDQASASPEIRQTPTATPDPGLDPALPPDQLARQATAVRLETDLAAMQHFSPSYPFWYHVFTVPDGSVAFGNAANGRLLVTFPLRGNWTRNGVLAEPSAAEALQDVRLPTNLNRRREEVVRRLETLGDPVLHNQTRGLSLQRNGERYGGFLDEWGAIYERFGVPADIELAQAVVESSLNGRVRSRARAIGFCQWLLTNWNRLKRLAPHVIEGYNQTTQAPYCAAYLTILATKYGSFIPALSEHHAGAANVGRTLINGKRLGGGDVRESYFLGAAFARDLRSASPRTFRALYRTFGPRSAAYAEMTFGNVANVERLRSTMSQVDIFAMRTQRARSLAEVAKGAGISTDEVRRFKEWDRREFDSVLQDFRRRFEATDTEEGSVMATTLAFVLQDQRSSRQTQILEEFRTSPRILRLFERGKGVWNAFVSASLGAS